MSALAELNDFLESEDSNPSEIQFESYGIPDEDLKFGTIRLLETDTQIVLPIRTRIVILTTSDDVLHS